MQSITRNDSSMQSSNQSMSGVSRSTRRSSAARSDGHRDGTPRTPPGATYRAPPTPGSTEEAEETTPMGRVLDSHRSRHAGGGGSGWAGQPGRRRQALDPTASLRPMSPCSASSDARTSEHAARIREEGRAENGTPYLRLVTQAPRSQSQVRRLLAYRSEDGRRGEPRGPRPARTQRRTIATARSG